MFTSGGALIQDVMSASLPSIALTNTSPTIIHVPVGSTTASITLPDATTLLLGHAYKITNLAATTVTVFNFDSSFNFQVPEGNKLEVDLLANSTTAGIWSGAVFPSLVSSGAVFRDANKNILTNNFIGSCSTTMTSASVTSLTLASRPLQQFTGSNTQIVILPNANSFTKTGGQFSIFNRSTSSISIEDAGNNLLLAMAPESQCIFTCTDISSANGLWDQAYTINASYPLPVASGGTNSSVALIGDQVMISSSGAIVESGPMLDGQILIGSTLLGPLPANLSQGSYAGITIVNASNSITLDTVQDIRTSASPSFTGLTVSGLTVGAPVLTTTGGLTTGNISLTTQVSGILPISHGGTGQGSNITQYGVIYASATTAMASTAAGTVGQPLVANSGSAPSFQTLPISGGGTGQITQQAAINALTGTQTSGQYLRSNGTNAVLSAIQAADVPTLNQSTTGTASNVTGTVAIGNGGTGQTTAALAINALLPSQTGNTGTYLTTNGSVASWGTPPTPMTSQRLSAIYGAVVGSAAQVTSGIATHSSLMTAIGSLASGGNIFILPTYAGATGDSGTSGNITISTDNLTIRGAGYNSIITGNLTMGGNECDVDSIRVSGTWTMSGNCNFAKGWIAVSTNFTNSGSGNDMRIISLA